MRKVLIKVIEETGQITLIDAETKEEFEGLLKVSAESSCDKNTFVTACFEIPIAEKVDK